ncbi:hypothetical protein GCM10009531_71780 [Actinoplanes capillaceus]
MARKIVLPISGDSISGVPFAAGTDVELVAPLLICYLGVLDSRTRYLRPPAMKHDLSRPGYVRSGIGSG